MPYLGIRPYNFSTKLGRFTQVIMELAGSLLHYAAIICRGLQRNFGTRHLAFFLFDAALLVPRHETVYVETINYQWSFYIPPWLAFRSSLFCQQSALICFREDLRIDSDYFPPHSIIWLVLCYNLIIIIIIIIKWYTHRPKPLYEEGDVTVLWNQAVNTAEKLQQMGQI